jgi:hypothetical protein
MISKNSKTIKYSEVFGKNCTKYKKRSSKTLDLFRLNKKTN